MTIKPSEQKLNVVSLFSGGGGLDLGFSAAGYDVVFSTDIDEHSCCTLELNRCSREFLNHAFILREDIKNLTAKRILEATGLNESQIDLVIGGPPCQAFSVFGRRKGLEDPRGNLVWEFLRIIEEVRPSAFLFENVDGIRTIHNGQLFEDIEKALSLDNEYTVSAHKYELAEYGIPQFRSRVFIIGSRNGIKVPRIVPTHGPTDLFTNRQPYTTVGQVLTGMPAPGVESNLPNHIGRKHSQRIIDRYQSLKFGERDPKTRINKLHPLKPSYAIIVGSDQGGGKGHIHPFDPREVTPRESARLQTFPDWWKFYGTGRHVIRQVGNAVPPLFAALLAKHIKKHIFGCESGLSYIDLVEKLELDFLML